MDDNSDFATKILMRQRALAYRPIRLVVDYFAGEGLITSRLWRHISERVICIERDKNKAMRIKGDNIQVIAGDNSDHIGIAKDADIIDCDAYGLVMPFIERIRASGAKPFVFFTDGTPEKQRKVRNADSEFMRKLRANLIDFHFEKSLGGNAYYGYGRIRD